MSWDVVIYFSITVALFIVFAAIVANTYKKSSRDKNEAAKYRMLEED